MMRKLMLLSAFGLLTTGALLAQAPSASAPAFNVSEHYTKYESSGVQVQVLGEWSMKTGSGR